jgi:hypothetical protein
MMKKKKTSHFSSEDIIRNEFRKSLSRGTIGKDSHGLLWAYGVLLKDSLYWVEVITIDMETHQVERIKEKKNSYEQREDATAYIKGLIKEILPMDLPTATINIP